MPRWCWLVGLAVVLLSCDGRDTNVPPMIWGPDVPEQSSESLEAASAVLCQKLVSCGMGFSVAQCLGEIDEAIVELEEAGIKDVWGLMGCVSEFPCSAFTDIDEMQSLLFARCPEFLGGGWDQGRIDDTPPPRDRPDAGMSIPGLDSAVISGDL
jgi:hypothetical protein